MNYEIEASFVMRPHRGRRLGSVMIFYPKGIHSDKYLNPTDSETQLIQTTLCDILESLCLSGYALKNLVNQKQPYNTMIIIPIAIGTKISKPR